MEEMNAIIKFLKNKNVYSLYQKEEVIYLFPDLKFKHVAENLIDVDISAVDTNSYSEYNQEEIQKALGKHYYKHKNKKIPLILDYLFKNTTTLDLKNTKGEKDIQKSTLRAFIFLKDDKIICVPLFIQKNSKNKKYFQAQDEDPNESKNPENLFYSYNTTLFYVIDYNENILYFKNSIINVSYLFPVLETLMKKATLKDLIDLNKDSNHICFKPKDTEEAEAVAKKCIDALNDDEKKLLYETIIEHKHKTIEDICFFEAEENEKEEYIRNFIKAIENNTKYKKYLQCVTEEDIIKNLLEKKINFAKNSDCIKIYSLFFTRTLHLIKDKNQYKIMK